MKPSRLSERIRTFIVGEEQTHDSELSESEYDEETKTVLDAMNMVFDERRAAFERATPKREPGVCLLGANSASFGPPFVDWRSLHLITQCVK